ncbi:MAG: sugar phosphate isomerase/epimerase family protein, partial [Ignavibacteria bacterium]|nr:sugar phosphate isomerase/epimerase family protein [Ignavibacteria bacterium]
IDGIKQASEIGYKGIELHIKDPKKIDIKSIFKEIERNKVTLMTIGTGLAYVDENIYFTSDDKTVRDAAIKRVCDHLDVFSELKPIIILGTIKGKICAAQNKELGHQRMLDCTKYCCDYAEKKKMHICVEAINRYEQDSMNTLDEVVDFIEKIGSKALLLHIDTFHMNIEESSTLNSMHAHMKYIGHVHVADNNRLPPGGGMINFRGILKALEINDYKGAISIECLPKPDGLTAARNAYSYLSSVINYL